MIRMESSSSTEPPADDLAGATGDAPDMASLVAFINAQHGITFRLTDRLLHGKRNVAGLYNAAGERFIVKWSPGTHGLDRLRDAAQLVDRLRSRWYPAPRYTMMGLHAGGWYAVQTGLPGAPIRRFSPAQVRQLVELNDVQRNQAIASAKPWPGQVVDDVLEGGAGYCLHEPMRGHSPATERLLGLVQDLVAQHRDVTTPTTDIVHFDFQQNNMLGLSGKISGVVDWDGAQAGDRAFDLTTVLFYAHEQEPVGDTLWARATTITDPAAVAVYLAHLIHRQVDWSIRFDDSTVIERSLTRAQRVWQEIPDRTGCAVAPWP
jgi:aminoglycoside phosphotransferase (APT) family kinase protein